MIKLALLIQISCLIILFIDGIESPKKGTGKKPKVKSRSVLDDSQFKEGAKIGFTCKISQKPLYRSPKKPKMISFQSMTIIRYTKITINGEIMFTLVCKRDTSTDSGDVVPPEQAEKGVAADAGGGDGGGDAGGGEAGGGDAGGGDAGGGEAGGGDPESTTGTPKAPAQLSLRSYSAQGSDEDSSHDSSGIQSEAGGGGGGDDHSEGGGGGGDDHSEGGGGAGDDHSEGGGGEGGSTEAEGEVFEEDKCEGCQTPDTRLTGEGDDQAGSIEMKKDEMKPVNDADGGSDAASGGGGAGGGGGDDAGAAPAGGDDAAAGGDTGVGDAATGGDGGEAEVSGSSKKPKEIIFETLGSGEDSSKDSSGSANLYSDGVPILSAKGPESAYSGGGASSAPGGGASSALGRNKQRYLGRGGRRYGGGRGRYGWGSNLYYGWESSRYSIGGW